MFHFQGALATEQNCVKNVSKHMSIHKSLVMFYIERAQERERAAGGGKCILNFQRTSRERLAL